MEPPGAESGLHWTPNLATKDRSRLSTRMGPESVYYMYIQVGLSQTPLGNDGMKKILLSTNTSASSFKSLVMSLLLETSQVGVIVLLTLQIMVLSRRLHPQLLCRRGL